MDKQVNGEVDMTDVDKGSGQVDGAASDSEPKSPVVKVDSGSEPADREVGPNGFPENTPIAEMTLEEQVAYHKYQKRKAEAKLEKVRRDADGRVPASEVDSARDEGLVQGLTVAAKIELARRLGVDDSDVEPVLDMLKPGALVSDGALNMDAIKAVAGLAGKRGQQRVEPGVSGASGQPKHPTVLGARDDSVPGNAGESVKERQREEQARIAGKNAK